MDKRTLQEKLNQPYDTENWKEIVQYVFPNVQLFTAPQKFYVPNEKVESFSQLGNVRLNDGKNLALFELTLKHNVNILRNRVELNNLVSQYIDQEQTHGVLSVFEQGQDDYRFTFSAKATEFNEEDGDFAVRRTDTKRFTYVLGKNESCRTPAERLFSLAEKKEEADIKAIQDAFSVEKLSKEFFNGYKEHYLHFVQHITGKRPQKVNNKWEDKVVHAPSPMLQYIFNGNEKNVRDFVKLMLGRLVFIHFVQKKRWLGVPAEQEGWQNGDPNFLFNGFKEFEHKDLFYSHFLEPLFNEALNKDNRPGDVFAVTGTKVPYLNGGLFEIGEVDVSAVDFPAALFEELLEFFNRFNFTIDESDLSEREVGIDPEMLGHIFENLLEDNKDKGAFYTPKEIVHYMCQESLKEYLKTKLEEESLWPKDEEEANSLEQALEAFIKRKEAGLVIDFDKALATALRDVKICDPAIGSGAFPMGLLNEIYHCMFTLYHASPDVVGDVWGMNSWEPDTVKKNIIQNSIYGVDIEKGAVDIARLRFWLSLLIEEETPNPLPNLDYKIVVGNSLVSKLGNEIIDIDWSLNETSHGLFGNEFELRKIELLKKISREQREFFNPESNKKKLAEDIRKLKIDLLINQLELMVSTKGVETLQSGGQANKRSEKSRVFQTEIYLKTQGWKNSINQLKKQKEQSDRPLQFFDWRLDFPEVLNELINPKPGFDIVIANPPYVSIRTKSFDKSFKEFFKEKYTLATGQYDLYVLFIEKTFGILKTKGIMSFIIPKRMLSNENFQRARLFVLNNLSIYKYVDAEMPFENANVEANIMLGKKSSKSILIESVVFKSSEKSFKTRTIVSTSAIQKMPFNIFPFIFDHDTLEVLFKIQNQNIEPLSVFAEITRGFECGYGDEAIDNRQSNYKLIKADSISSYTFKDNELIYCNPDFSNPSKYKTKELFESVPKLMTKFVARKMEFAIDFVGYYNTNSVYNIHLKRNSKVSFEYLLGILNSRLSTFWFNTAFLNTDNLFPHIQKNQLEAIPIKYSNALERKILPIVSIILSQKPQGQCTAALENKIDNLVYRLYDLTYDEVKVIDPKFPLSREEYENIKLEG